MRKYLPRKVEAKYTPDAHQLVAYLNAKEDKFTTSIYTNNHGTLADEPQAIGGEDYGMAPYEFVIAGLAACTTMTLNMYAQRKELPLDAVKVYVTHDKVDIPDEGKVDVFTKEIELIGELDEAQRKRLVEIAAKCPVHRTLSRSSKIETSLRIVG